MRRLFSRRFVLPAVLFLAGGILASVAAARGGGGPPRSDAIEIEGAMPQVDADGMTGGRVRTSDFSGHVTVVNFWASWCGPCRREQPALERLSQELEEVRFLGINFRDDEAAALEYLSEFDVSYPSVQDRDGLLAYEFGVPYLPATILVDPNGEMRYRLLGAQTETSFLRYISELVSEE